MNTSPSWRVLRFGLFEVDVWLGELRKQGLKIRLQDQPFQILVMLLEQPGELVTREQLHQKLWPSDTFVNFDHGLNNAVNRLREALGDSADRPRFIETLPRKGYRFIASVDVKALSDAALTSGELESEVLEKERASGQRAPATAGAFDAPSESALAGVVSAAPGERVFGSGTGHFYLHGPASWYRRLALVAGVALLLVGIAAYNKMTPRPTKPRATIRVTRLTHSGNVHQVAISPDGKYAAYFQSEKGYAGWSLWLQQIGTSARTRLLAPDSTAPAGDEGMRFSPNGGYLYYTRIDPKCDAHSLYRISVLGGTPEELLANVPSRFALSPDGRSVAHLRSDPRDGRDTLVVMPLDGSAEKVVAIVPQGDAFSDPAWSPDGKLLAVGEYEQAAPKLSRLLVLPLNGSPGKRITSDEFWGIGEPEWLPDGSGLVATALGRKVARHAQVEYEGRYPQLWEFPYPGGSPRRITDDVFRYFGSASVSADSSVLATVASDLLSAVWVGPASNPDRVRAVTPLSGHYVANKGLTWTGSGKILYWTNATDAFDLIVMDADGNDSRALSRDLPYAMHPDACSDGHTVVYSGVHANKRHVMRRDLDGGLPQPLVAGAFPQCSPDSKWVVYYEDGVTGVPRKIPLEGGQPVSLTEQKCERAGISPDGRWVACVDESEKLAIIPFSGGKPFKLFDLPPTFDRSGTPIRWTPDSQSLVYAVDEGGFENLWSQRIAGGPPRALTHYSSQDIDYFAFSHDGQQIAIGRGTPSSDVVLISNFR